MNWFLNAGKALVGVFGRLRFGVADRVIFYWASFERLRFEGGFWSTDRWHTVDFINEYVFLSV